MGFPTADRNSFLDDQITGTLFVALYTVAPDDDGVGGTEVTGGSYARVSHASWNAAANGSKTNNGAIDFAEATASWGTVVAAALMDAASGGNQVAVTDNVISQAVASGSTVSFADDALTFNFT